MPTFVKVAGAWRQSNYATGPSVKVLGVWRSVDKGWIKNSLIPPHPVYGFWHPFFSRAFAVDLIIAASTNNYNLCNAVYAAGWDGIAPVVATLTIDPGVTVGSTTPAVPALDISCSFPSGSSLDITNNGTIMGYNGAGGAGAGGLNGASASNGSGGSGANGWENNYDHWLGGNGGSGGTGLGGTVAGVPLTLVNNGTISGGGGGGGGGGGNNTYGGGGGNGGTGVNVAAASYTPSGNLPLGGGGGGGGSGNYSYGATAGGSPGNPAGSPGNPPAFGPPVLINSPGAGGTAVIFVVA